MALSREEAARIAELARLELAPDELDRVAAQLSSILEFAKALNQLELGNEPLTAFPPADAPLRADAPDGRTLDPDRAVANAPATEAGFFLVPPVVEDLEP